MDLPYMELAEGQTGEKKNTIYIKEEGTQRFVKQFMLSLGLHNRL